MQIIPTRRAQGAARPRRLQLALIAAGAALLVAGCDLDLTNPNSPTQEATLTSPDGMLALGVGIQNRYGTSTGNLIYTAGLVTDELGATAQALVNVREAEVGTVQPNAGLVADLWNSNYRVVKSANDIIRNAYNVTLDPGTRSGLVTLAYLFKGIAIADLTQGFQKVAINTVGTETPTLVDRATALAYSAALLDTALKTMTDTAPSAAFSSTVLARGFDLKNTINAYRARVARLVNNDAAAVTYANLVDRRVFSILPFTAQAVNPVFNVSSGSSSVLPRDAWRLSAAPADSFLVKYHVAVAAISGFNLPLDNYARFTSATSPIPAYYPDEVLLIKAEALARQNQLTEAQAVLDSVRTDCPGLVADDPNACLAPLALPLTQTQLLDEIYRMRRYELFATGLRWEDARRRGLVGGTSVAKRCWLPYPVGERNANPSNIPADPEGVSAPAFPATCTT